MKLLVLLIVTALLTAACSIGLPAGTHTEFRTRITQSGLKHFQLRLIPENPAQYHQATDLTRQPKAERNPDRAAAKRENVLLKQVRNTLAENRYCRQGYWLLDKNLYGPSPWVRGECNEGATETDREKYPDTIQQW